MMNTKGWLLIVLGILVAIFVILKVGVDRRGDEKPLFVDFEPDLARRIVIDGRERQTVLERQDDVWIVTSEDSFPAEPGVAAKILEAVPTFLRRDIASTNPNKQGLYQVDSSGIEVKIEDASGVAIASFIVGKVGPDYRSTFVRGSNSQDVILVPAYLPGIVERGGRTWQDMTIYAFEPTSITDIKITRPGETITMSRAGGGDWVMTYPESAACDQNRLQKLTRALAYLRADEIVGRMPVAGSGLEEPDSLMWFRLDDGSEQSLLFGNITDGNRVYTKRQTDDTVYMLPTYRVHSLLAELDRLKAEKAPEPAAPTAPGS